MNEYLIIGFLVLVVVSTAALVTYLLRRDSTPMHLVMKEAPPYKMPAPPAKPPVMNGCACGVCRQPPPTTETIPTRPTMPPKKR
jgi:hypothetical protein